MRISDWSSDVCSSDLAAMMSPDLTVSPSLTSHLASEPSSIVGDSAGILISIAISVSPHQHVGIEFGCLGLGRLLSEIGGLVHFLPDLLLDLLDLVRGDAGPLQFALGMLDRIGFVAHRLNLVAAAIFGGVGHRMAPVPIGLHLEDDRPLAGAHPGERFLGGAARREHVHPRALDARDADA